MPIATSLDDGITTIRLDDGKLNTIDGALVVELRAALTDAYASRAVIVTGTPGVLTAGLDTKALVAMTPDERLAFFVDFGTLILNLWIAPVPVVCAATGHAIAAGTLLALASDQVIAARGDYRWGMTEARIGLELSDYAIMLVRGRVAPAVADKIMLEGQVLDPETALHIGLVDELHDGDAVLDRAGVVARELAALPPAVYARNKSRLRATRAVAALAALPVDIARLVNAQDGRGPADA